MCGERCHWEETEALVYCPESCGCPFAGGGQDQVGRGFGAPKRGGGREEGPTCPQQGVAVNHSHSAGAELSETAHEESHMRVLFLTLRTLSRLHQPLWLLQGPTAPAALLHKQQEASMKRLEKHCNCSNTFGLLLALWTRAWQRSWHALGNTAFRCTAYCT